MAESTFLLPGPAGQLEVLTTPRGTSPQHSAVAIICHPHPLYSGTMHNKVVTTLAQVYQALGLPTVRFNFRGVGKSTGSYGDKIGELADLLAIMEWVKQTYPTDEIWLAGFSFGACVSVRAAVQWPVARLVSVALPIYLFDPEERPAIQCPWVLVQGDQDDIVSAKEVYTWIELLAFKPQVIQFEEAGHFFHGKLVELRQRLVEVLKKE